MTEEGTELLGVPHRQPVVVLGTCLGRIGARHRVDAEASPAHGVVAGAVQDGVHAAHRGGRERAAAVDATVF